MIINNNESNFASGPENLHSTMSGAVVDSNGTITYEATLQWLPATATNPIIKYDIFRGTSPHNLTQIGETTETAFTDHTVSHGQRYFYSVIAFDSTNTPSPRSNIASVTI